jgi:hypothetical protein
MGIVRAAALIPLFYDFLNVLCAHFCLSSIYGLFAAGNALRLNCFVARAALGIQKASNSASALVFVPAAPDLRFFSLPRR